MKGDGITAVVVSHFSEETIGACLSRLLASEGVSQVRIIDNASTDGTMEVVQRYASSDSRVHFVANPDNPGFAVACNQGAADSDAPWLAFVNPDLMVEPDTLARLRLAAEILSPALVGAELVGEDGEPDPAARRRDPDFAAMLTSRAARELAVPRAESQPLQEVDAVSGALMVLPRTLFRLVGGFDEDYRLHAEDLDLCRRIRAFGGRVAIANDVRVLHVRGVSSRARPAFVEWHKHRGLWRYFRKFDAGRHGGLTNALVWAMIWGRFPFAVSRKLFLPG